MKKNYLIYVMSALLACACSSNLPEETVISKSAVDFAGNAFSSFSLGADMKLYTVQNPDNTSQWTIQAVVPVRKVVNTPIHNLSIDLFLLDERGARVREGLVLQGEDLPNLLPVFNASENEERAVVFSIQNEEKKYLSADEVSQLLKKTKGARMIYNDLTSTASSPVADQGVPSAKTPDASAKTPQTAAQEEFPMTLDGLCRKYGIYGKLSLYEQALSKGRRSEAKRIEDQLWAIERRVRGDRSIPERLRDSFVNYIENKEDAIEDRY